MEMYHLKGRRMCGRAVRVEALDSPDIDANLAAAAKLAGKEATILEIKKIEWRNGVKLFVKEISEPCEDMFKLKPEQWKKVTPGMLDDIKAYFGAKDMQVLEALFREYHDINPDELDAIMGKAVPVASEG
jgi:hypothetical protein